MSTKFMTNIEIVEELTRLREELRELKEKNIIDELAEVSLNKAAKLLNRGMRSLIQMIDKKVLPARKEISFKNTKTGKKKITYYRIRVKDIVAMQTKGMIPIEKPIKKLNHFDETMRNIVTEFHQKRSNA